ncbi:hypothetical protein LWI28_004963 [Acer negundo]|uniref:AMP-dependent synthetase/ligase domain-containing protein n=1 Tax=Acer negundo TaxID=4023 RepID=A0AAD5P5D8_ACENE|nr:hypothetical protein LWI28_004963 [Acer negundo]
MSAYIIGALVPLVFTLLLRNSKNAKKRGLPVDVGGEPGYAIRNHRFSSPVSSSWEGISTLAELFEESCKQHREKCLLGTRKLISRENEVTEDGRSLRSFTWETQLGHKKEERVAIFADTREEWFLALQGCFRRNVTVVTIYASLGEEALCHSLNETEVTTVICGSKELKKLVDISGQLDTVKRVICLDVDIPSNALSVEQSGHWKIISFADVQNLGQENPVDADYPVSADIAVIMYTRCDDDTRQCLATVSAVMTIVPGLGSKDVYLAFLPLAHILEIAAENLIAAVGSAIGYGTPLTLTDTSNKIKKEQRVMPQC